MEQTSSECPPGSASREGRSLSYFYPKRQLVNYYFITNLDWLKKMEVIASAICRFRRQRTPNNQWQTFERRETRTSTAPSAPPTTTTTRIDNQEEEEEENSIASSFPPTRRSKVIHYPNEFSSPSNHPTSRLPLTWWITNENGRVEYQLTAAGESTFLQTSFSLRCRTAQTAAEETLFL